MAEALAVAPDVPVEDIENPRSTAADWKNAVASRNLPELQQQLAARRRGPGRAPLKIPTTIRFHPEVLAATGKGWQSRVYEAMREWIKSRSAG